MNRGCRVRPRPCMARPQKEPPFDALHAASNGTSLLSQEVTTLQSIVDDTEFFPRLMAEHVVPICLDAKFNDAGGYQVDCSDAGTKRKCAQRLSCLRLTCNAFYDAIKPIKLIPPPGQHRLVSVPRPDARFNARVRREQNGNFQNGEQTSGFSGVDRATRLSNFTAVRDRDNDEVCTPTSQSDNAVRVERCVVVVDILLQCERPTAPPPPSLHPLCE